MTGSELRERRERCGLSVEWCAARIGRCNPRTWRYWEKGRDGRDYPVPADVADQICRVEKALRPWQLISIPSPA